MSQGADRASGVVFESVVFRGYHAEVSFTEEADRGDQVTLVRTMVINGASLIPGEHAALLEALRDYVDAAQVVLRNPPERLPGLEPTG
jgi:hypothetical protein